MKRSDEIRSIINLKLQACRAIYVAAHEKVIDNMEDITRLLLELEEITDGTKSDQTITL